MAGTHNNPIDLNNSREGDNSDDDEEVDVLGISTDRLDFEQIGPAVDDTIPYFQNVPQSTPIKGLQKPTIDLVSPIKTSHKDGKLQRRMSLSEGDLSQSIDSLNLSDLDERFPLKKRPRNSTETIETKFKQLQTPIYLKERLNNDEIANILTDTSAINRDKVCSRIPAGPPGKGQWSFLIDLDFKWHTKMQKIRIRACLERNRVC